MADLSTHRGRDDVFGNVRLDELARALRELDREALDGLFIETAGNLACPARFDQVAFVIGSTTMSIAPSATLA